MEKVIYKELSYKIVGVLFEVYNELGPGHKEKHYQSAVSKEFRDIGLKHAKELCAKLKFKDEVVGQYYFDFLVEDKIILELKCKDRLSRKDFDQVKGYLSQSGLKLGILALFNNDGVTFKRILPNYL
ncbi:hypothetical protein A2533_04735 [Candidatus Falkowbacteria bacterium RIFOXYD2_FULL_35_9]|uniref:GxxExxY protein n=1 Tax=Candidatus Falkowbacteria bacterium RIFOXYC2_FULL_36_12 TaxID=1798002 RepID=A0A1F5T3K6_9BACT|nr:MAG: hypothetical protein A2300_04260 [Candidatus Falkowbacteria bacterium RIFOXYB2_FULL_35_7]OGF33052.1 MAG: hypothetical protein A2223_04045 [Candidatus Falkowbacteria bacterium RIFOXYA2_FULL_35_8]OGF33537.1 MAG: hypothetical protein A2478_01715 [Candidatus Falkowbacteria bacterium RIFOXYC2_FULL_36_12]OGF46082.1 MAG: hypothetical protein A2533_04735 [Candidatus Falkowbacteria bacterium RIFOXYD2_FULL_35_9]